MATAYLTKQSAGTASTSTYATLYSTGASTTAVVSAIHICNESTSDLTVRVGIAASATTPASGTFWLYDRTIPATETLTWGGPFTLGNTAYVRVSSSAATVSFTAAVAEIS